MEWAFTVIVENKPKSSFPRSAWERKPGTLCVTWVRGLDAERPDVRSLAERGNEE